MVILTNKQVNRMWVWMDMKKSSSREAERPKVPTEWYTILITAGKKAEYRARPIWCQDAVDTDTNSKTMPGSY